MKFVLTITLVAVLLAGAGAVAYVTLADRQSAVTPPIIAHAGLRFLEGTVGQRVVRELGVTGETTVPLSLGGALIDYAPDGYAITRNLQTGLWSLEDLERGTVIASSTSGLQWLSVSPDGRFLAYAERNPLPAIDATTEALAVYDPAEWSVRIVSRATGSDRIEATGSMPRLFVRDGATYLLYVVPGAVRMRVLFGTYAEYSLPYPTDGLWPVEVSADGRYLALFNEERMTYDVHEFSLADGLIALAPPVPVAGQVRVLSFDGTTMYALMWSPEREAAHLAMIDLKNPGEPTVLADRPGLETVRRIISPTP